MPYDSGNQGADLSSQWRRMWMPHNSDQRQKNIERGFLQRTIRTADPMLLASAPGLGSYQPAPLNPLPSSGSVPGGNVIINNFNNPPSPPVSGPAGPAGPTGPTGPTGPAGSGVSEFMLGTITTRSTGSKAKSSSVTYTATGYDGITITVATHTPLWRNANNETIITPCSLGETCLMVKIAGSWYIASTTEKIEPDELRLGTITTRSVTVSSLASAITYTGTGVDGVTTTTTTHTPRLRPWSSSTRLIPATVGSPCILGRISSLWYVMSAQETEDPTTCA